MIGVEIQADSKTELIEKCERYFNDYHPCGYGTHFITGHEPYRQHKDGKWFSIIQRSSSCD